MQIVTIVGSLRKDSYNKRIALFMQERYRGKLDMDILYLNNLPLFNVDMENDPPEVVKEFKEKIRNAEGVFIVSPEYNHSIPGGLKNALDWCSRGDRVLVKKPVFMVGASDGNVGTARMQGQLHQILNAPGVAALTLPGNHVLIPNVQNDFDESGNYANQRTIKYLDKVVDSFLAWSKQIYC